SYSLPENIYAAVDSCETIQKIWLHVQQMMKGYDIGIQDKKAKLFNEWERFTSTDGESIESYYHRISKLMNEFKRNKYFPEKIASNLKFLNNLQSEWRRHVTIVHQTKDLHEVDYTQLYEFLKYNHAENGLIVVPGIANPNANQNGNGNIVAARAEGNDNGNNKNQIRCYNYRGLDLLARNCTEEAWIRLQAEEFDFMAAAGDLDEIEDVNANCILMANLQQASTLGTQIDNTPVYDSDGSTEVHEYDNFYNNEIFNMFTRDEHVEQSGGTVEQNPATIEETHAYFESLYNNLAIEVEKVNTVNRKVKETNADLTIKLARYKNQGSESSSRCSSESRRKTHHDLRQTSASEERTKIRMMKLVSIGKWLTESRRPSLNERGLVLY
ncbi:hypothetical protein Tco_0060609, partial [Tanacetum coccineum]